MQNTERLQEDQTSEISDVIVATKTLYVTWNCISGLLNLGRVPKRFLIVER